MTWSATLTLLLAGCASNVNLPPVYQPSRPPSAKAVQEGVKKGATEAKLTGGLEISVVRHTDHGPGSYFVCLKQTGSTAAGRPVYSVFFDNDDYKGIQSSVLTDACEAEPSLPFK
ncbi:hypothetical protein [Bradyrhizobium commune]|uniref:hypothetical protein n=1 Tax=Bradyrhizobium commune TaxID=83627 RepID=UPI001FEFDB1C|nr:hypothetical protein [Bradyrhizobium commune]